MGAMYGQTIKEDLLKQCHEAIEKLQKMGRYLEQEFERDYETVMNSPLLSEEKVKASVHILENLSAVEAGISPTTVHKYPFAMLSNQLSNQRLISAAKAAAMLEIQKAGLLRNYLYDIYADPQELTKLNLEDRIAAFQIDNVGWAVLEDSLKSYARRKGITLREVEL